MTDEKFCYIEDVVDRADISKSAHKRSHKGGKKSLKMPSDYLTKKEKEQMNSDVVSCKIEPIKWNDFKKLPISMQKYYLETVEEKYHVPASKMFEMFGVSHNPYYKHCAQHNLPTHAKEYDKLRGNAVLYHFKKYESEWLKFLYSTQKNEEPIGEEPVVESQLPVSDTVESNDICAIVANMIKRKIPFTITIKVN